MERISFVAQRNINDCGLACLRMIMSYYRKEDIWKDVHNYPVLESGVSLLEIARIAKKIGFKTLSAKLTFKDLKTKVKGPCIAFFNKAHFVVIYGVEEDKIYIGDPAVGLVLLDKKDFIENWVVSKKGKEGKGICLLIEPGHDNQKCADK